MAAMASLRTVAFAALILLALAPEFILALEASNQLDKSSDIQQKRELDTFLIYNRKRNAHGCVMSIVFIVLYPLGAIGIHLPIDRIPYLRNSYLVNKVLAIHAPIQFLGFVGMVGGMVLGIQIAKDLGYFSGPTHAHMVVGLLVTSTIILFQPALGILQHLHYVKTGRKSVLSILHRWIGRGAIILGMINTGLGFQLASANIIVPTSSYIREYVFLGVLASAWLGVVVRDNFRSKPQEEKHVKVGKNDILLEQTGVQRSDQ